MSQIYFGTRNRMVWVKAPAVNTPLSSGGWASSGTDLNGGGYAHISPTYSKEYEFSWGASPAEEIYAITDYRSGAYGTGLLFYLDPFAMKHNVLNAAFSFPLMLCNAGKMGGTFTTSGVAAVANEPVGVAVTSALSKVHYVPVPTGYTLWVSYRASANVLRANGVAVTATAQAATTRVWASFSTGTDLQFVGTGSLWGVQALVLPNGVVPSVATAWELGKGNSGIRFSSEPQINGITAKRDLVSGSVSFKETGLWE